MLFALGFLVAALIALGLLPAVSRRAERLARRRAELLLPASLAEIAAERDGLRAEAAVEIRRAELRAEAAMRTRDEDQAELGRRAAALSRLEDDVGVKARTIAQLETNLAATRETLAATRETLARTGAALEETRQRLAERDAAHAALEAGHRDLAGLAEERRMTIAALETTVMGLRSEIDDLRDALAQRERSGGGS